MIVIFVEFIDQLIDYPINRASRTFAVYMRQYEDVSPIRFTYSIVL